VVTRHDQVVELFNSVVKSEVPGYYLAPDQPSFYTAIAKIVKNPYGTGFQPQGFESQAARGWRDAIAQAVGLTEFQRCQQLNGITEGQAQMIIAHIVNSKATLVSDNVVVRGFKTQRQREANMTSNSRIHGTAHTCVELKGIMKIDRYGTDNYAWVHYEDGNTGYIFDSYQAAHLYLGGTIIHGREYDEFGELL